MTVKQTVKKMTFLCAVSLLCACSSSTEQSSLASSSPKASPKEDVSTSPQSTLPRPVIQAQNTIAKSNLWSVVRSQQSYYLENGQFAQDLNALEYINLNSEYYTFEGIEANTITATFKAVAKDASLSSYAGGVSQEGDISTYQSIVCKSRQPSPDIAPPNFKEGTWSCGPDSKNVKG